MKKQIKILSYPAIFDPAEEGGFNVSFPFLQGCVTFGKNFEQAKEKAQELLELWLKELASEGKCIPATKARPIVDEVCVKIPAKAKIVYVSNYS